MLSDLDVANLLQAQYDGRKVFFNVWSPYGTVSWAMAKYDDCDVICFEGSHNLPDWKRDFEAEMIQVPGLGGVHEGFYIGLPDVLKSILPLTPLDKRLKICGHSLGGGESHIFTGMAVLAGYTDVETITFGSPLPGDKQLSDLIASFPNRSYWNFRDGFNCDIVGNVPFHIPVISPYVFPRERIIIESPPAPDDNWGICAWHHLSLYVKGLQNG